MTRLTPLFISLILFLATIGVYAFLSFQIVSAISLASADRQAATVSSAQAVYEESVSGLLKETETERATLALFVPTDENASAIIQEIEDAATYEKVSATIGSVGVAESSWSQFEPLEVQLSARGSLAALVGLATELESLPQASHISSFTLESSGNHTWFATYVVDFVKVKSPQTP